MLEVHTPEDAVPESEISKTEDKLDSELNRLAISKRTLREDKEFADQNNVDVETAIATRHAELVDRTLDIISGNAQDAPEDYVVSGRVLNRAVEMVNDGTVQEMLLQRFREKHGSGFEFHEDAFEKMNLKISNYKDQHKGKRLLEVLEVLAEE